MVSELGSKQIRAVTSPAPLPPLNNIAAPAIVIEVGASDDTAVLTSPDYQQSVARAAAAAISSTRAKLEEMALR